MRRTFEQMVRVADPVSASPFPFPFAIPSCPNIPVPKRSMMIGTPVMSCVNLTEHLYLGEYWTS